MPKLRAHSIKNCLSPMVPVPTDRLVSGSVQFDHGAAGLDNKVSAFGCTHTF